MSETPIPAATPTLTNHSGSRQKIYVPERAVNGGFDMKFEVDPYDVRLHGILTSQDYTDSITVLNDFMKPARSKKIDGVLLATGPLLVPLGVWGVRHGMQTKKRKKLLLEGVQRFNTNHPELLMRWNKKPQSCLTIECRATELTQVVGQASSPPVPAESIQLSNGTTGQNRGVVAAHAEIVPDTGMYDTVRTPSATAYHVSDTPGLV
mmetsp:Transcript_2276/g.2732  ORF Transcript_2276/g.2732 Transcript_2276/m.2732 type:complete len:207 (-) Transcript_2276:234-854(-)